MSPDGELVVAGRWTKWTEDAREDLIYLFEAKTGKTIHVISGLPMQTVSLAFSWDGRYLAIGLGKGGLRVFDRDEKWGETFRDTDYNGTIYGVDFATDGRLATTSLDGMIRLYDGGFRLVASPKSVSSGNEPWRIAFSPDGWKIAVGFADVTAVDLFGGQSLAPLPGPNLDGLAPGALNEVVWLDAPEALFAGGRYTDGRGCPMLSWADAGQGKRGRLHTGNGNTIVGPAAPQGGGLLVAAADPFLAFWGGDGIVRWTHCSPNADFRYQTKTLAVSADGMIIDFGFDFAGRSPMRFDLRDLRLSHNPRADNRAIGPKQDGLSIEHWRKEYHPTHNGRPIVLVPHGLSLSMAVHPGESRYVLETEWYLRAYNAKGERLWLHHVPGQAYAVNISGDGRLVVAAYRDGTIRWHRMDDGRELLALCVLADKQSTGNAASIRSPPTNPPSLGRPGT